MELNIKIKSLEMGVKIVEDIIELTEKNVKFKVLIPIKNISSIFELKDDGTAFVETGTDKNGNSTGFVTNELYSDVRKMLAKLVLFN